MVICVITLQLTRPRRTHTHAPQVPRRPAQVWVVRRARAALRFELEHAEVRGRVHRAALCSAHYHRCQVAPLEALHETQSSRWHHDDTHRNCAVALQMRTYSRSFRRTSHDRERLAQVQRDQAPLQPIHCAYCQARGVCGCTQTRYEMGLIRSGRAADPRITATHEREGQSRPTANQGRLPYHCRLASRQSSLPVATSISSVSVQSTLCMHVLVTQKFRRSMMLNCTT